MQSTVTLYPGDNRVSLQRLIDDGVRVHSVVTDPPYGLVSVQKRFGKDGSAAARTEGNDGSFARLSGGFMGKCFHPDTEVMTNLGWKRVDSIQIGEVVATLNPLTRDLEWQAVAQTHIYPFDGQLVHVKHRSSEQMITPNHKMLVSNDGGKTMELTEPKGLKHHFHMFAQANPIAGKRDLVRIESTRDYGGDRSVEVMEVRYFDPSAFFNFFGLWLGDGYAVSRSNDHPANDFCGINVKKHRKKVAVRHALESLGCKFTETVKDDGFSAFYIYDFALLGFLKNIGNSYTKHIPVEFFEWDSIFLEDLYRGLMETDGTVQGEGQEVFFTSSRQLAADFQRLCLHTGRSASVKMNPGGKEIRIRGRDTISNDAWVCCVLQAGKRLYGEKSTRSSNVIYEFPYLGDVFCIGVPKHHIIYTRFNGKPAWTGNSWDGTGIERDPDFWKLIYDILLPGGYVFAFSGSRTGHWQACAMETAGFVMHPMHGWVFGSGFPKAHAADKAIDKHLGVERKVVGQSNRGSGAQPNKLNNHGSGDTGIGYADGSGKVFDITAPATPEAAQWEGWAYGTQAQKPALEPIYLGQKPFSEKTGAANLLKHGVGAVNIDGCRVPINPEADASQLRTMQRGQRTDDLNGQEWGMSKGGADTPQVVRAEGRHPANLILDGSPEVVAMFPDSKGQQGDLKGHDKKRQSPNGVFGEMGAAADHQARNDSGSAARFFHQFPQNQCCLCEQEVELCDVNIAGQDSTIQSTQTDDFVLSNAADLLLPESADKPKALNETATYAAPCSKQTHQQTNGCAQRNAAGSLEAEIASRAKSAVNLCGSCATVFAQSLVQTSQGKNPESLLSQVFITERKKQILIQSLALIAATPESIATTTTTANLKMWFGFVLRAIEDATNSEFLNPSNVSGGPLRYSSKAGKLDRAGSKHPTVKPIALMQYLIRHITPPGGIVLDPFAGSGTTAEAARREGFDVILMEAEQEYVDFLNQRFNLGHAERSDSLTDLTGLLDNVTNDLLV